MVCGIRREASREDAMAEAHVAAVYLLTQMKMKYDGKIMKDVRNDGYQIYQIIRYIPFGTVMPR